MAMWCALLWFCDFASLQVTILLFSVSFYLAVDASPFAVASFNTPGMYTISGAPLYIGGTPSSVNAQGLLQAGELVILFMQDMFLDSYQGGQTETMYSGWIFFPQTLPHLLVPCYHNFKTHPKIDLNLWPIPSCVFLLLVKGQSMVILFFIPENWWKFAVWWHHRRHNRTITNIKDNESGSPTSLMEGRTRSGKIREPTAIFREKIVDRANTCALVYFKRSICVPLWVALLLCVLFLWLLSLDHRWLAASETWSTTSGQSMFCECSIPSAYTRNLALPRMIVVSEGSWPGMLTLV